MLLTLFCIVFGVTTVFVPMLAHVLQKKGILDHPDHRTSHDIPTPRGGGLVVMPVIFLAWVFLLATQKYMWPNAMTFGAVIVCSMILCGFTWLDDHMPGGLRVRSRLVVQFLAVIIPLCFWPESAGRLLPDVVPFYVERVLMALAWVWFANLYNFMDGINGISGMEAISITGGLLIYTFFTHVHVPAGYQEILVVPMAAAAGFLVWNARPVAKIFLGDVGSIGMGYCLAFVLFVFAAQDYLIPATLLTLVYSMDPTITLIKRAWQKKKIWVAHREFFFHRVTVKGGLSHLQCVGIIFCVNILLLGIGLLLLDRYIHSALAFYMGLALVTMLLVWFYKWGKTLGHQSSPRPKPFRVERIAKIVLRRRSTNHR